MVRLQRDTGVQFSFNFLETQSQNSKDQAMKAAVALFLAFAFAPGVVFATGLATCDSGPQSSWQSQETLTKILSDKGWTVRRIKIDGGCYEAYVVNDKGERQEAYFHPVTLAPVPTKPR